MIQRFVKGLMRRVVVAGAAAAVLLPTTAGAAPVGTVTTKWNSQPTLSFTLTPNYFSGFGTVKATLGTQPTPAPGPNSCLDGCTIDFGNVIGGTTYLYKYAAHLHVTSNDSNGFYVYAEGAADFYNTADGSTYPLNTVLYYLNSTSGSPADSNNGYSPGLPIYKTSNVVTGNSQFTMPTITYGVYPAPIASSSSLNGDYYYDYEMKVPNAATGGLYYVWVVYTVVAK